jgi:hypothetical protein
MKLFQTSPSTSKILLIVAGSQFAFFTGAFAGGHHDFNGKNVTAQISEGPKIREHTGSGPGPNNPHPYPHPCHGAKWCFPENATVRDHRN